MYRKIAELNELEEGKILVKETRYQTVGLLKRGNEILAFEDICTHDGELISNGVLNNTVLECPRHKARFDLKTGKPLCMPATEPIPIIKIRISGNDIEAFLEE